MIFKTFDSDIDKWTSKIGIFEKSLNDIFEAKNQKKLDIDDLVNYKDMPLDAAKKQVGSFLRYLYPKKEDIQKQLIDVDKLIPKIDISNATEVTEKIKKMSESVAKGEITWQKLFDTLPDGEKQFAKLGQQMKEQIITEEGVTQANQTARDAVLAYNEAIKAQTLSAKASKVALQTLATVGNMLAMWAISKGLELAVKGIDNLIHKSEKAREKLKETLQKSYELTETYKQEQADLDSTIEKYKDLNEQLMNAYLTTEEYNGIKEQLVGLQDDLVSKYGDEAGAIDIVNGKYDEQIKKYRTFFLKEKYLRINFSRIYYLIFKLYIYI